MSRMNSWAKILIVFAGITLMISAMTVLPGCNTVKGVGRDIESVGQAGEDMINGR